jgi:hypothetical protein
MPVLTSLAFIIVAQLIFTYASLIKALLDTHGVPFVHGAAIIGVGIALFAILEHEKLVPWRASTRTPALTMRSNLSVDETLVAHPVSI